MATPTNPTPPTSTAATLAPFTPKPEKGEKKEKAKKNTESYVTAALKKLKTMPDQAGEFTLSAEPEQVEGQSIRDEVLTLLVNYGIKGTKEFYFPLSELE